MKNIILTVVLLFITTILAGYEYYSASTYIDLSKQMVPDTVLEENFYRERIPAEFAEAFLYYTSHIPEIRMNFYSIMVHESGNFRFFRNRNRNGSVDLGPSQLNSDNLKNPRFVKAFKPKDESMITTKNCYYMVMTIGYYHDLYTRLGDKYAFYAYNGGDRAAALIRKNNKDARFAHLLNNVRTYDSKVRSLIQKHTKELKNWIEKKRFEHVIHIVDTHREMYLETLKDTHEYDELSVKDRNHTIDNGVSDFVFRRKYLFKAHPDEFGIIRYSLIDGFNHEFG